MAMQLEWLSWKIWTTGLSFMLFIFYLSCASLECLQLCRVVPGCVDPFWTILTAKDWTVKSCDKMAFLLGWFHDSSSLYPCGVGGASRAEILSHGLNGIRKSSLKQVYKTGKEKNKNSVLEKPRITLNERQRKGGINIKGHLRLLAFYITPHTPAPDSLQVLLVMMDWIKYFSFTDGRCCASSEFLVKLLLSRLTATSWLEKWINNILWITRIINLCLSLGWTYYSLTFNPLL